MCRIHETVPYLFSLQTQTMKLHKDHENFFDIIFVKNIESGNLLIQFWKKNSCDYEEKYCYQRLPLYEISDFFIDKLFGCKNCFEKYSSKCGSLDFFIARPFFLFLTWRQIVALNVERKPMIAKSSMWSLLRTKSHLHIAHI